MTDLNRNTNKGCLWLIFVLSLISWIYLMISDRDLLDNHFVFYTLFLMPFICASVLHEQYKTEERLRFKKAAQEIKLQIVNVLKREGVKLPASDIDFELKISNVNLVKKLCEELYKEGKIGRTGNYRYFISSSENKSKETSMESSDNIDLEAELKKLKDLYNQGLITKEQYKEKSDKLIGI